MNQFTKDFEDLAMQEGVSYNEILKKQKSQGHFSRADRRYGGRFTENLESEMLDVDKKDRPHKLGKSLDQFIDQQSPEAQEEDIYEWYQSQMEARSPAEEKQRAPEHVDKSVLNPDMPRFEDYFETTAKGLHPFDSITDKVNEHLDGKFDMTP